MRSASDVCAVVDQVLGKAIPARNLVAQEVVKHAAKLYVQLVIDIHVEGRLENGLLCLGVVVETFGILELPVEIVAGAFRQRSSYIDTDHVAIPFARGIGDTTGCFIQIFTATRPGALGIEVQVTAHLRGSIDRRGRSAHDVHAISRPDRGCVVAGIVDPAHASEIVFALRTPNIQRAGNAEERLGKRTR